ncbi:MAG: UTP--glucose-1-phosphate uridylyltransferase [Thermoguttaceae bacterium]
MNTTLSYKELCDKLAPYGQEHLLRFWDVLSDDQRCRLADQITAVDFSLVAELYQNRDAVIDTAPFEQRAKEPPAYKLGVLSEPIVDESTGQSVLPAYSAKTKISKQDAISAGKTALAAGSYAVILVAGGQGTRLGFDQPKGMFPIGPVSGATLFQIHLQKAISVARKYGVSIPFCVMTSPATHEETVRFLDKNDWFGLPESDRFVFCQGTMPAVSLADGKVLLAERDSIALSPNGHGGMLAGISQKPDSVSDSILDKLAARGVKNLFYFQVDNPFVDICNPEFIGYHILSQSEMTSQVIRKREPSDRVGNVVELDGRLHVIEYSDIPASLANKTTSDGSLEIWAGSIAVHQFNVNFLKRVAPIASALPFHIAKKKVSYVDTVKDAVVTPYEPNAIKFERFIFDLMPSADNSVVVEVDIPHNYGPLKNAPGSPSDSPETVRKQLSELYTEWLTQAGIKVVPGVAVEISPLYANGADDLKARLQKETSVPELIEKPTCFV